MTSEHIDSAIPTNVNLTANTNTPRSRSSFFRNHFSNASLLSISSARTLLPRYSLVNAVEEPPSSTSNAVSHPITDTNSPTSSFFRRFSNASLLSLSSVRTLPPQYSVTDTLPARPLSPEITTENRESLSGTPSSPNSPSTPHYSLPQPTANTVPCFGVEGDPQTEEFRYSYPIRAKKPWATLHLHTRVAIPGTHSPPQSQPRVPRLWSCDPITGTVQLDFNSPQNIQQISIMLKGNIVLLSHARGSLPFLKREFTIWDKSMDDPLHSDNAASNGIQKKIDTRLVSGQHMFPFSFPFPTQIDGVPDSNSISPFRPNTVGTGQSDLSGAPSPTTPDGPKISEKPQKWTHLTSASNESPSSSKRLEALGHPHTSLESEPRRRLASSMPQTFMEKDIDPHVAYDISVRIVHGRFKISSKITTNIACIPASEPLPASQKRREAYEAGALVPCPMDDPEGWFALPTVKIYGMVKIEDNLVHTRVDCTLYIAQPLSYTRGSLIPCFITIHSDDVEVAHLLPSTGRPAVRLLRRVWHPMTEHEDLSLEPHITAFSPISSWEHVMVSTSDMNLVTHLVGYANWWIPSKDVVQGPNVRELEGEIHLSPDLQPSCDLQLFRIEYAVELLSLQTANFTPEVHPPSMRPNRDTVLASKAVEITTLHRQDEPVPTAYSEPPKTYRKLRISSDKGAMIFKFENDK